MPLLKATLTELGNLPAREDALLSGGSQRHQIKRSFILTVLFDLLNVVLITNCKMNIGRRSVTQANNEHT